MPNSLATLVYTVQPGALVPATLAGLIAAVPLPTRTLADLGVELVSDTTVNGPPVVRTIVLRFAPTVDATATAVRFPGGEGEGGEVSAITLTGQGSHYTSAPKVKFSGGTPFMAATAKATLDVASVGVLAQGAGYTAPTLKFVGGLAVGGRPAQATLTVVAGHITAVTMTDAGAGYVELPTMVITDTTGSGAILLPVMQVDVLTLLNGGRGYLGTPTISFVPSFKEVWPDAADQRQPFFNLMTAALAAAACCPVVAAAPVIS